MTSSEVIRGPQKSSEVIRGVWASPAISLMRDAISLMREVITWIASCSIPCVSDEGGNQTDEVFNHLDRLLQHPLRL